MKASGTELATHPPGDRIESTPPLQAEALHPGAASALGEKPHDRGLPTTTKQNAISLRLTLPDDEFEIVEAVDGIHAVELIDEHRPDLLILH